MLHPDKDKRASVAEVKAMKDGSEGFKMTPVEEHRSSAIARANIKAKYQQTFTVGASVAGIGGNLAKKHLLDQKIESKNDIVKPLINLGVRSCQIETERRLRNSIKSTDFTKKVGLGNKMSIAAAGSLVMNTIDQFVFQSEKLMK